MWPSSTSWLPSKRSNHTLSLAQCHSFWGWESHYSSPCTRARKWSEDGDITLKGKELSRRLTEDKKPHNLTGRLHLKGNKTHHLAGSWNRQDSLVVWLCWVVPCCQVPHPGHPDDCKADLSPIVKSPINVIVICLPCPSKSFRISFCWTVASDPGSDLSEE